MVNHSPQYTPIISLDLGASKLDSPIGQLCQRAYISCMKNMIYVKYHFIPLGLYSPCVCIYKAKTNIRLISVNNVKADIFNDTYTKYPSD